MSFRNERHLYRRTCDASGKQIVSIYKPDNGYKVYDQKVWYSDSRNALDYAKEYDFSKTFTENFLSLSLQVPRPSMYNFFAENSDYCNCASYQKDCYLTSASTYNEKCMYCAYTNNTVYSLDTFMTFDCEHSYYTIDCEKSYKLIYANNCRNCSESYFMTNCNNCNNCFDCDGLENSSYCFQNQPLPKEDYYKKIENINLQNYISWRESRNQIDTILFSEDCTGNHIRYSKRSQNCIDSWNLEDCINCTRFFDAKDCRDNYSRGQNAELCYENVAIGENISWVCFSTNINTNCTNIRYSMHCRSCSDCFGCCGLSGQQYCIFNKQYTKEEYENLVAKIITHMQETGERWEFFHPSLSPFGYNETVAQEYYPLQKGDPLFKRYQRSDYESPKPLSDKVIQWKDLPNTIDEIQDDILQYAIACEITGKLFRIQPQELVFYRKHHIPLPRKHPDQRHLERLALRK